MLANSNVPLELWGHNPIARWQRQLRAAQFIRPKQNRVSTGNEAAQAVAHHLEKRGFSVTTTSHKAPYDLLANDCLKIEVKYSSWQSDQGRGRYSANIRSREADVIILALATGHHFIIPTYRVAKSITIRSQDPSNYRGKYKPFLEAWNLLGECLVEALDRPHQLRLGGVS